jgi:hypothetical protein
MAIAAHIRLDFGNRAACRPRRATGTNDLGVWVIGWMNIWSHVNLPFIFAHQPKV